jgi:hypothetical protein
VWFVALAAAAESPRAVVVEDGLALLALGSDGAALPSGSSPDGLRWTEPVVDEVVAGVHQGDAWRVLGADGTTTPCTVVGFRRLAADAQGFGSDLDPTCGGWLRFAELSCEGPVASGIGVPGSATDAVVFRETPPTAADHAAATAALQRSENWKAAVAGVKTRGLPLQTEVVVRAFGPWRVVEASAYTGEGWTWCGGEDALERRVLVLDAAGVDVLPARTLAEPAQPSDRIVDGVYDLDHDGVPELRVTRPLQGVFTIHADDAETEPLPTPFCGCPC